MRLETRNSKLETAKEWLPDMDLNHDKQIQSLLCYRYTIGQPTASVKLKCFSGQSSRQTVWQCPELEFCLMNALVGPHCCAAGTSGPSFVAEILRRMDSSSLPLKLGHCRPFGAWVDPGKARVGRYRAVGRGGNRKRALMRRLARMLAPTTSKPPSTNLSGDA